MIIQRPGQKINFVPGIGINVIMPQSAAAASWWLSGGISAANCVAAYQAKGAASYAASKINLANPGTHNLADGSAIPGWSSASGWIGTGTGYLTTDITASSIKTAIVRYSISGADYQFLLGAYQNATTTGPSIGSGRDGSKREYNYGGMSAPIGLLTTGVAGIAGGQPYLNGVADGAPITGGSLSSLQIWLLCRNIGTGTANSVMKTGNVEVTVSLYDAIITPAQVLAVSTAMLAL